MKNIFLVVCIFNIAILQAQNKKTCGTLEYTCKVNSEIGVSKLKYKLVFNDSIAYSEEIDVKKDNSKEIKTNEEQGVLTKYQAERKNLTPTFYYKTPKTFYFSKIIQDKIVVVKEDNFKWNWQIHDEYKQIGSFECQKATIRFRGRNYTAWFTNQIPVNHGLWKFQGLMGMILEVYDADNFFHITTENISLDSKNECIINFDKKQLTKAVSVKKHLELEKDEARAYFALLSSKLPKGSPPMVLDENCDDCNQGKLEIFE